MRRYKVIEGCNKKYNYHIVDTKKKIKTNFIYPVFRIVESLENEWLADLCCDALNEEEKEKYDIEKTILCESCNKKKCNYKSQYKTICNDYELPF